MLVSSRQSSSGKDYQGFSRAYVCRFYAESHQDFKGFF